MGLRVARTLAFQAALARAHRHRLTLYCPSAASKHITHAGREPCHVVTLAAPPPRPLSCTVFYRYTARRGRSVLKDSDHSCEARPKLCMHFSASPACTRTRSARLFASVPARCFYAPATRTRRWLSRMCAHGMARPVGKIEACVKLATKHNSIDTQHSRCEENAQQSHTYSAVV